MIQLLQPHPTIPAPAVERVQADARRHGERLILRYVLAGDIGVLAVPAAASPARRDELWKHTCFEAFVQGADDEGYLEFNLSPSGEWAAYAFGRYREGMRLAETEPPHITTRVNGQRLELATELRLPAWADIDWRVGLTAVIEDRQGERSYWALRHGPAPDFHRADCFVLRLPAGERP